MLASTWLACHPVDIYNWTKASIFLHFVFGMTKITNRKFVAKFEKPRNLTHTNAFTSIPRPARDQNQFLH